MRCEIIRLAALSLFLAASLWGQDTLCDLFKDLRAEDGRELIVTGELLISKDLAVLGAADCENEFVTRIDKQGSLGWPTAVRLRPSAALPPEKLEQFLKAAAEVDRLRQAGKPLNVSASFAGRLRVTAMKDFSAELTEEDIFHRKGGNEFPAELTFYSIENLKIEELPDPSELPVIPICDLFQNLLTWQGKRVAVRAESVSNLFEGGWIKGNCKGSFYTGEYRWPVALSFTQPGYYSSSTASFSERETRPEWGKGEELLRGRKNVTRAATYVGRLRMRSTYTAVCREGGRYVGNGFVHNTAAALILEDVRDIEVTPGQPAEPDDTDDVRCHPPNYEALCAAAPILLDAVSLGCVERTKELLSKDGIDSKNSDSASLRRAIRRGDEAIVKLLLDAGAPLNPALTLWPPLHDAASPRRIGIMKMLLKEGAEVDGKDYRGNTYLSHGSFDTRVGKVLLDAGANPNARDDEGATALMHTATFGEEEAAKLLIRHGADVNLKDNRGQTALMYAAAGPFVDTIPELLAAGADLHARDLDGKTALDIAMEKKNLIAEDLLSSAIRRGR